MALNVKHGLELNKKNKISHRITEYVFKDSALSYRPNDIYEIIEGDEYDVIIYDYKLVYVEDYMKSIRC